MRTGAERDVASGVRDAGGVHEAHGAHDAHDSHGLPEVPRVLQTRVGALHLPGSVGRGHDGLSCGAVGGSQVHGDFNGELACGLGA